MKINDLGKSAFLKNKKGNILVNKLTIDITAIAKSSSILDIFF